MYCILLNLVEGEDEEKGEGAETEEEEGTETEEEEETEACMSIFKVKIVLPSSSNLSCALNY